MGQVDLAHCAFSESLVDDVLPELLRLGHHVLDLLPKSVGNEERARRDESHQQRHGDHDIARSLQRHGAVHAGLGLCPSELPGKLAGPYHERLRLLHEEQLGDVPRIRSPKRDYFLDLDVIGAEFLADELDLLLKVSLGFDPRFVCDLARQRPGQLHTVLDLVLPHLAVVGQQFVERQVTLAEGRAKARQLGEEVDGSVCIRSAAVLLDDSVDGAENRPAKRLEPLRVCHHGRLIAGCSRDVLDRPLDAFQIPQTGAKQGDFLLRSRVLRVKRDLFQPLERRLDSLDPEASSLPRGAGVAVGDPAPKRRQGAIDGSVQVGCVARHGSAHFALIAELDSEPDGEDQRDEGGREANACNPATRREQTLGEAVARAGPEPLDRGCAGRGGRHVVSATPGRRDAFAAVGLHQVSQEQLQ